MNIRYPKDRKRVEESYELLEVLEFNSTRKRMSVILKNKKGKILLYSKGADNILLDRMKKPVSKQEETQECLTKYANGGLRTLIVASKEISQNEYNTWKRQYQNAQSQLQDREKKMMDVQELIEKDLSLVGGTAIEDKLQEDVG